MSALMMDENAQIARDAAVLSEGLVERPLGKHPRITIQATARSLETLRRAGYHRVRRFASYKVTASKDVLGRWKVEGRPS